VQHSVLFIALQQDIFMLISHEYYFPLGTAGFFSPIFQFFNSSLVE